jgi:hypothetical protein
MANCRSESDPIKGATAYIRVTDLAGHLDGSGGLTVEGVVRYFGDTPISDSPEGPPA